MKTERFTVKKGSKQNVWLLTYTDCEHVLDIYHTRKSAIEHAIDAEKNGIWYQTVHAMIVPTCYNDECFQKNGNLGIQIKGRA